MSTQRHCGRARTFPHFSLPTHSTLPRVALVALLPVALAVGAQTPRQTGRVGAYTPPVVWPQRARTFDLLHQRIAISYDLDKRSMAGEVETRLIVRAQPTDTIRLDASQLTIDGATDAAKQNLKFRVRHLRSDRSPRQACTRRRHGRLLAALSWATRARHVLRPAPPRDVDAGRGDRDAIVGADVECTQRQDHVGHSRHCGHGRERALQRTSRGSDAGERRREEGLALVAGEARIDLSVFHRGGRDSASCTTTGAVFRSSTGSRRIR